MKRLVFFLSVCITILLAIGVSSFLVSQSVHASGGSSIQMLSGTFADQNLPVDNVTKITLISIPFSVLTTRKLEVTNFMDVTPNGAWGYAGCELDMDDVSFFSVHTNIPANSTNVNVGLTGVLTGITPGNHTLAVKCLGFGQYGQGMFFVN